MRRSSKPTDLLIEQLAGDLRPVRPLRIAYGLVFVAAGCVATLALIALILGLRADVVAGRVGPMFIMASGLFLLLGLAAASAVVLMASPYVGNRPDGWRWALATTCLLPLAALATAAIQGDAGGDVIHPADDLSCIFYGTLSGSLIAVALTAWLRRGAPTRPGLAGFLTGMASGAIGVFAYGFHCPIDGIHHLGIAHAVPIGLGALAGWAVIPRLVRW